MGKGKSYIDFLEKFVSERSFRKLCSKMWNWKLGSLFFKNEKLRVINSQDQEYHFWTLTYYEILLLIFIISFYFIIDYSYNLIYNFIN